MPRSSTVIPAIHDQTREEMEAQQALNELEAAQKEVREITKTITERKQADTEFSAATAAAERAREKFKDSRMAFEGREHDLYMQLDSAKNRVAAKKERFDTIAYAADHKGIQLSLWNWRGKKVAVQFTTKLVIDNETPDQKREKAIASGKRLVATVDRQPKTRAGKSVVDRMKKDGRFARSVKRFVDEIAADKTLDGVDITVGDQTVSLPGGKKRKYVRR